MTEEEMTARLEELQRQLDETNSRHAELETKYTNLEKEHQELINGGSKLPAGTEPEDEILELFKNL